MIIKLYESYGALAHERRPVYSETVPATDAYSIITVNIPDAYPLNKNWAGETLIDIDGNTYLLSDVLSNHGDAPALKWFDGNSYRRIMLEVIK